MTVVDAARDLRYEAAVLRGALLLGLVHERDIRGWAESALGWTPALDGAVAAVATTAVELSAMRAALGTFAAAAETDIADALLAAIELAVWGPAADPMRVLTDLRRFLACRAVVHDGIRDFDGRVLLAAAAVPGASAPDRGEIEGWIARTRPPVSFRWPVATPAAALHVVAAVSSAAGAAAPCAEAAGLGASQVLRLDETAWALVSATCAPVPFAARIPYVGTRDEATDGAAPPVGRAWDAP